MTTAVPTARRLRRVTAGASLVLFAGLLVPQALIDPAEGGTGEVMFRAATEQSAALTTSAVLLIVSALLMAPAAAGVLHQARDRGAGLANAGAVLAVLGGFGHFGIAVYYIVSLSLARGDEAQMTAFIDRLNSSAVLGFVVFPLILSFALAVLVLPWAAWRAGAIGIWGPAVATAAVLVEELLPFGSTAITVVVLAAVTVVFGYLGVRVLRMTDSEWDGVRSISRTGAPVSA